MDLVVALLLGLAVNADENLRETSKKNEESPVGGSSSTCQSVTGAPGTGSGPASASPRSPLEELDLQNLVGAFLQQGSPHTYSHSREEIEIDQSAASVFIHSHSN